MEAVKLRLHETSRETSQVGLLPAPRYLSRVKVYLAEIITCFPPDCILFFRQVDVYTWRVSLDQAIWSPDLSLLASCKRSLKAALHDVSTECASQVCKLLVCDFSEESCHAMSFTHGEVFHASSVADFMLNWNDGYRPWKRVDKNVSRLLLAEILDVCIVLKHSSSLYNCTNLHVVSSLHLSGILKKYKTKAK
jgi:hypothetical protein